MHKLISFKWSASSASHTASWLSLPDIFCLFAFLVLIFSLCFWVLGGNGLNSYFKVYSFNIESEWMNNLNLNEPLKCLHCTPLTLPCLSAPPCVYVFHFLSIFLSAQTHTQRETERDTHRERQREWERALIVVPVAVDEGIEGQSIIPATGEVNHVDLRREIMDIKGQTVNAAWHRLLKHYHHNVLASIFIGIY